MKLYRCDWPRGDVSFVFAKSVDDAILTLDESDGAQADFLTEVHADGIFFTFSPAEGRDADGKYAIWTLIEMSEAVDEELGDDIKKVEQFNSFMAKRDMQKRG